MNDMTQHNNPNAPDRQELVCRYSGFSAAGDWERCAALVLGWDNTVKMQPTCRHYADYFAMGLLLGLCSVNEVITWVDQFIEDNDRLSEWMIEVSTSTSKHPLDIIHVLDLVPGSKNLEISLRLLIAKLDKVYPILTPEQGRFAQPKHSQLLSKLYFLVREHNILSDDVRGNIFQIYLDLDYVEQGYDDWSIIQQDYKELLAAGTAIRSDL